MGSIRNAFQKLHKEAPSGSEPVGKTSRQREILRLAYFLRQHVKTGETLTSYRGRSPAGKYEYQKKSVTPKKMPKVATPGPHKSTPKPVSITNVTFCCTVNDCYSCPNIKKIVFPGKKTLNVVRVGHNNMDMRPFFHIQFCNFIFLIILEPSAIILCIDIHKLGPTWIVY